MNYIAHLHIAQHTDTDLLGNFMGDFVKGSHWQSLPNSKQIAVQLHRWVDSYTDSHSRIKSLYSLFPGRLRRFGGLATDICFDHILLTQWEQETNWQYLFERFYHQLEYDFQDEWQVKPHFHRVRARLLEHRWLAQYQEQTTCLQALRALESRARFNQKFAEDCYTILDKHKPEFIQQFKLFYPELLENSKRASHQLTQESGEQ